MNPSVFLPPYATPSIQFELIRLPNAAGLARSLAREWFLHWGAPEHVREGAELISSELVTNAVTKTKSRTICIRLRWSGSTGYVEVWDDDPKPPVEKIATESDTAGRGLFLVGAYSTRWDFYPSAGGKVVWAELATTHVPPGEAPLGY